MNAFKGFLGAFGIGLALMFLMLSPAQAHLPIQLFQGSERYESGIIRELPPNFDPESFPKMVGGLYRVPPEVRLGVELRSGPRRGERVTIDYYLTGNPSVDVMPRVGERIIVVQSRLANGELFYQLIDYDRRPTLAWVTGLSLLSLLLVGWRAGLKAISFLVLGLGLLYGGMLPVILHGIPPVLLAAAAAMGGIAWAVSLALPKGAERQAAWLGATSGLLVTAGTLLLAFHTAHITGLATAEALVLYSQSLAYATLDFRQIWLAGALLSSLGGLVVSSLLTARAIARHSDADPWIVGRREAQILLPTLALGTVLLYFGLSISILLISQLGAISPARISLVRLFNYDYLVSVILAWQCGLFGLVASLLVTAKSARFLRRRHAA